MKINDDRRGLVAILGYVLVIPHQRMRSVFNIKLTAHASQQNVCLFRCNCPGIQLSFRFGTKKPPRIKLVLKIVIYPVMSEPKVLMLDEPSLGLAPLIVQQIFELIEEVRRRGTTVLLVEQNVQKSLRISDYAWEMENGNVSLNGTGEELINNPDVKKAYLGL